MWEASLRVWFEALAYSDTRDGAAAATNTPPIDCTTENAREIIAESRWGNLQAGPLRLRPERGFEDREQPVCDLLPVEVLREVQPAVETQDARGLTI